MGGKPHKRSSSRTIPSPSQITGLVSSFEEGAFMGDEELDIVESDVLRDEGLGGRTGGGLCANCEESAFATNWVTNEFKSEGVRTRD